MRSSTLPSWDTFQTYLLNDRKMSDKPGSVAALKSRFKTLSSFFMGKDFNRENFNLFIGFLRGRKYSTSYINNFTKMGKHVDRYLKLNKLSDYTYFKENKVFTGEILAPHEILAIANVELKYRSHQGLLNTRYRLLYLLLGTTGCRVGECISLRFDDVKSQPYYVIFRDTKNGNDRMVPISKELYDGILNLPRDSDFVFSSSRSDGELQSQGINLDLKKRALACGIKKKVWCHLFRHSFITTCLDSGMDSIDVAELVGHKDTKTTLRYRHSNILHFSEVALMHPLRRDEMSFEQTKKSIRDKVEKMVASKYPVRIEESNGEFILRIAAV